jgi:hypothetical protein
MKLALRSRHHSLLELIRERLVVQEYKRVVITMVELIFYLPEALRKLLCLGVARQDDECGIGIA